MSRIASVKETGEEISQTDWQRFEQAVQSEVAQREPSLPGPAKPKAHGHSKPAGKRRHLR